MTCVRGGTVDGCKLTDALVICTHDGYTKLRERKDDLKHCEDFIRSAPLKRC